MRFSTFFDNLVVG